MGWSIKTNHKDSWQVYSTTVDDIIADFTSESDLKNWIAKEAVYGGKLKAIEHLLTFPSQWSINDERVIIQGSLRKFHGWYESILEYPRNVQFKMIDDKLSELTGEKVSE